MEIIKRELQDLAVYFSKIQKGKAQGQELVKVQ